MQEVNGLVKKTQPEHDRAAEGNTRSDNTPVAPPQESKPKLKLLPNTPSIKQLNPSGEAKPPSRRWPLSIESRPKRMGRSRGSEIATLCLTGMGNLPQQWRERAELFRSHAEEPVSRAYEVAAEELEESLREESEELLNLQEAASVSGYSADHLGRLVRDGKIPNAGRSGAPRIRRGDLPIRYPEALRTPDIPSTLSDTKEQIVRSVANLKGGCDR